MNYVNKANIGNKDITKMDVIDQDGNDIIVGTKLNFDAE